MSGMTRETELEPGLQQTIFSLSYKFDQKVFLCESCSSVIKEVRKLQDQSLRISEDIGNVAAGISAVLRIRGSVSGKGVSMTGVVKPEKLKSNVKEEQQRTLEKQEETMEFQKSDSLGAECLDPHPNDCIPDTSFGIIAESDKEEGYLCNIDSCGRIYPQEMDLWVHQKRVHGTRNETFSCYFCGQKLSARGTLYEHLLREHVMELPETCSVNQCRFKAAGRNAWRNHLKMMHPIEWKKWDLERRKPKEYKCTQCPEVFKTYPDYRKHYRRHKKARGIYACETCGKGFQKWIHLQNHIKLQLIKIKQVSSCEYCGAKFGNRGLLKHHQRNSKICAQTSGRATDLHRCPSCPKSYMTEPKLKRHVKTMHNPNRKYKFEGDSTGLKCYFCEYVVQKKRLYCLYEHMSRLHLNELPLACEVKGCSYRTAVRGVWLEHMKRNHKRELQIYQKHQKLTTFKCSQCPKECKTESLLLAHKKTHGRPRKTFQCQQCERSFFTKVNLQEHLIIRHGHGGTTYPCPHESCKSLPFANRSRLNLHIKVSHIQEEAKCQDCGKTFKNSVVLREHHRRNKTCAKAAGRTLPFPCTFPSCSRSFAKTGELKRHVAFAHLPKYKCKQCEASFVVPNERELHMLSEHGGIPCFPCMKLFENSKTFQKHCKRQHSESKEEKKFKCLLHYTHFCYFCDAKFRGNFSLERHLINAHLNEKFWTCGVTKCRLGTSKSRLEIHMKTVHPRKH